MTSHGWLELVEKKTNMAGKKCNNITFCNNTGWLPLSASGVFTKMCAFNKLVSYTYLLLVLSDQYVLIIHDHSLQKVLSAWHILSQQSLLIVLLFLPTLLTLYNPLSTIYGRQRVLPCCIAPISRTLLKQNWRWAWIVHLLIVWGCLAWAYSCEGPATPKHLPPFDLRRWVNGPRDPHGLHSSLDRTHLQIGQCVSVIGVNCGRGWRW